ncbi:MAG: NAD(P)/FAD-dependent oxidoreductase [Candidatus Adiutrix sp.]
MNIVIAGFGVAGATAAEVARKQNPSAYITVFSKEKDLFYYRIRLPEVVSGALTPEKLIAHPKSWYDERKIDIRLGESVAEINPVDKTVRGSLGSRQNYDRLLLAVGAECNRPSFPGDKLAGIYTVRSLNDAFSLLNYAQGKQRAVLIGGGLLGLEMGYSLAKLGLKITVVERDLRILPRQTTEGSATLLRKKLAAMDMEFILAAEVSHFEGDNHVSQVVLKNGTNLAADVVLISAGVVPELGLAKVLGLEIDRAIVVNPSLETSINDIYAAGDCATFPGAMGGLWVTSREQALIAGINIATTDPSQQTKFLPTAPTNTLKVAGIALITAGNIDPGNTLAAATAYGDGIYRKVVFDPAGHIVGFTNVGTTHGNKELNIAFTSGKILKKETITALEDTDFDFSQLL